MFIQGQEPMEEPKTSEVAVEAVPEVQNDAQESSDAPAVAEDVAEKPDESKDKEMNEGANIFVENLDPEVNEKLLQDTFSAFGVILQTRPFP